MLDKHSINQQIELAAEILRSGGIVAFPTDTVYGLGADPRSEEAVGKIYRVKRRSNELPLPLLLVGKADIERVAVNIPETAWRLAERFLPGGLTLVLEKSSWVPDVVTAGGDTVAVRIPDHDITIDLIQRLGSPLVGTSANISGRPSPVTADEVYGQLGDQVDLVIDGGECPGGIDSTVVDVSGEMPTVVREGAVSWQELSEVCGPSLRRI